MRKTKTLVILSLVTVAVVLAAVFSRQQSDEVSREGQLLFPKFIESINDVSEIEGVSGTERFTLSREGSRWVVRERSDYPALLDDVHQLLVGAAQLKRLEQKTSNPELHAKLGLESETATSLRLTIKQTDGATLADVLVGNTRSGRSDPSRSEYYVRLPDDDEAWLVQGKLPPHRTATDWLDKELLTLGNERVREARIVHPDGEEVVVHRDSSSTNDYELMGLPDSAQIESAYAVNRIANALTNVSLDDVKLASDLSFGEGLSAELITFDGLRVNMETTQDGDVTYARFSADFDAARVVAEEEPRSESTDLSNAAPEATVGESSGPSAEQEAEKLNSRWETWAYALPDFVVRDLNRRNTDLTKQDEDSAQVEEEGSQNPPES